MSIKKLYKKIYKSYQKKIKQALKNNNKTNFIDLFILQLEFLRDITSLYIDKKQDIRLFSLCLALDYYYNYRRHNVVTFLQDTDSPSLAQEYWEAFWESVKLNLQDWIELNAYLV